MLWEDPLERVVQLHRKSEGLPTKGRTHLLTKDILADADQSQIWSLLFAYLLSAMGLQLYKERKAVNQSYSPSPGAPPHPRYGAKSGQVPGRNR